MRTLLAASICGFVLTSTVYAQTAGVIQYGRGTKSTVGSNLDLAVPALKAQTLPNEYCYGFKAPRDIVVLGFSIYTKMSGTSGGPIATEGGFYPEATAAPSPTQATKGPLVVGLNANFYTCIFATEQTVKKDASFWVSQYDSNLVLTSSTTNGKAPAVRTYWRRPAGGTTAWSPTGIVTGPVVQIIIKDETPIMSTTGVPKLGNTKFSIDISNTNGSANLARMVLGISDSKTLGGLKLPFDLGVIGFKGSTLYASDEFYLGPTVTTGGSASFALPVPTTSSLDGLSFYTQAFIVNTTTTRVTFTNAVKNTIGSK